MKLITYLLPLFLLALLIGAPTDAQAHDHASHELVAGQTVASGSAHCSAAHEADNTAGPCCKNLQAAQTDAQAHCSEDCPCDADCGCHTGGECASDCTACADNGQCGHHQASLDNTKASVTAPKVASPKAKSVDILATESPSP